MPRITKDTRLTMRMTDELRAALEREADRSGRSLASEVVQLMSEALAARERKGARRG